MDYKVHKTLQQRSGLFAPHFMPWCVSHAPPVNTLSRLFKKISSMGYVLSKMVRETRTKAMRKKLRIYSSPRHIAKPNVVRRF